MNNPSTPYAGGYPDGKQFYRKGPGSPGGHQVEQQKCTLATKTAVALAALGSQVVELYIHYTA